MSDRLVELIDECGAIEGIGRELLEKKADYLLANGVIVLPCKVGDTVYIIDEGDGECAEDYVLGVEVLQFFINKHGIAVDLKLPLGLRLNTWAVFGKTVFLTREEAEKALKGDGGNEQKRALRP